MSLDPIRNFALGIVSQGFDAAATSITLQTGHGARFPSPAVDGAFNLVWFNITDFPSVIRPDGTIDPQVEIVRCTARTADTLTVIRAQEGTSATAKNNVGKVYAVMLAPTRKVIDDIRTGAGTIANVVTVQTREQGIFAAPISGNGTVITPLDLTITPRRAGNRIILEWIVNGESLWNAVYIVTRNGILLAGTTDPLNNRWAGITVSVYDNDHNSTPIGTIVKIIDMSSLGVASTYRLHIRSSEGIAHTLFLNRTANTLSGVPNSDMFEATLSMGIATEIWA